MEINMERFNTYNWIMTSRDDKIKALQELEKYYAEKQKRPFCEIKAVPMDDIRKKGRYVHTNKTIEINEAILTNDYKDRYNVIDTIIHEGRHAYQHFAVDNPQVEQNQNEVKKWKENFVVYHQPENSERYLYRLQAVERDAFNYSESEMDNHFKNMVGETDLYSDYMKNLHCEKKFLEKEAQQIFGRNFENIIDGDIELLYIRKGARKDNAGETRVSDGDHDQITSIRIGDFKKIIKGRIDEINMQQKELNRECDLVKGEPLTKQQAEKLASSDYVKGEDVKLDQQSSDLKIKQDKLKIDEKSIIEYGKEHGLDKTLWRHAPEIFKGEGLKYYEASLVTVEKNKKVFDRQGAEIESKIHQLQERINTPEARLDIAKKSQGYLAKDQERIAQLEALDRKLGELKKEKIEIIQLKNILPSRNTENEINLHGDVKDIENVLQQTDQIKQQMVDIEQTMVHGKNHSR